MGQDHTRELPALLRTWGYGEGVLRYLEEVGLVERYDRYGPATRRKCLFNRLTEKGLEYLEFLDLHISNKEGLSYLHAGPGQGVLKSVST